MTGEGIISWTVMHVSSHQQTVQKDFGMNCLDEESSYLTIFGIQFGQFQSTVIPYGIPVTSDKFERKLDTICRNLSQLHALQMTS